MASILKTGSLEKAGWQRRRDARRVSFAGKVKNVIVTLPSVPKARQRRRRKSSEAALVQTFLVLRQAWPRAPPTEE